MGEYKPTPEQIQEIKDAAERAADEYWDYIYTGMLDRLEEEKTDETGKLIEWTIKNVSLDVKTKIEL